jgi:hypothetical protein
MALPEAKRDLMRISNAPARQYLEQKFESRGLEENILHALAPQQKESRQRVADRWIEGIERTRQQNSHSGCQAAHQAAGAGGAFRIPARNGHIVALPQA